MPLAQTSNNTQLPSNHYQNNKQQDVHDFIRTHKSSIIILFLADIFILAAAIIALIASNKPQEKVPEIAPIPYYEHRYLLDYTISRSLVDGLFSDISKDILSPEEIASAPQENPTNNTYTISLDEDSFISLKQEPKYTYKTNLSLSDGRSYVLYVRIDQDYGQKYMVAVLNRTGSSSSDHIYIYINPSLDEKEKNTLSTSLANWAKTLAPNNPIITNLDLKVPEK